MDQRLRPSDHEKVICQDSRTYALDCHERLYLPMRLLLVDVPQKRHGLRRGVPNIHAALEPDVKASSDEQADAKILFGGSGDKEKDNVCNFHIWAKMAAQICVSFFSAAGHPTAQVKCHHRHLKLSMRPAVEQTMLLHTPLIGILF